MTTRDGRDDSDAVSVPLLAAGVPWVCLWTRQDISEAEEVHSKFPRKPWSQQEV